MTSRFCAALLACLAVCSPLQAQRATPVRFPTSQSASRNILLDTRLRGQQSQQDDNTPGWLKGALVGGGVGALGGWVLSGLPCENAQANCPSKASSILAGAAIGAVVGALITWHHD